MDTGGFRVIVSFNSHNKLRTSVLFYFDEKENTGEKNGGPQKLGGKWDLNQEPGPRAHVFGPWNPLPWSGPGHFLPLLRKVRSSFGLCLPPASRQTPVTSDQLQEEQGKPALGEGCRKASGRTGQMADGRKGALADSRMCGHRNPGWILWSVVRLGREWGTEGRGHRRSTGASSLAEVGEAKAGVLDTAAPEQADGDSSQALGCLDILCLRRPHETGGDILSFGASLSRCCRRSPEILGKKSSSSAGETMWRGPCRGCS